MIFDESDLPKHVAILMDGNRRWAKAKGLPVVMGHKKVAQERVEELIEYAGELKIPFITFWPPVGSRASQALIEERGI